MSSKLHLGVLKSRHGITFVHFRNKCAFVTLLTLHSFLLNPPPQPPNTHTPASNAPVGGDANSARLLVSVMGDT